jgi:threonine/homoserine/homoserine lactone efflux protein
MRCLLRATGLLCRRWKPLSHTECLWFATTLYPWISLVALSRTPVLSQSLLGFLAISILVIVTPGPDTAMTIRGALMGGRSGGLFTAFGVAIGQIIWALATSAGIVALLLASETAFHTIKLAGAAYLMFLGARSVLAALHGDGANGEGPPKAEVRLLSPLAAFRQGLISDLGNPKMAVFFVSVLPQFAEPGEGMLSSLAVLGVIFSGLTFAWLALYSIAFSVLADIFRRGRIRRAFDLTMGLILIALGLRLAIQSRS